MKYIFSIIVGLFALSGIVHGATGSTSTGSTSTGGTLSGVTLSGATVSPCRGCGGGGPSRAWNQNTNRFEMYPQCFPWAWLFDFYKGNVFMIYENQRICRQKAIDDFGF